MVQRRYLHLQRDIDSNFAYAILAILSTGFILWTAITSFVVEHDIDQIISEPVPIYLHHLEARSRPITDQHYHSQNATTAILYNADGFIDTRDWQEYCNEEYGFCVKYPEGWEIEKYKSFSIFPALGPIDCEKTPERCPFEKIGLYKLVKESEQINRITSLSIARLPNDYKISNKNSVNTQWMDGLITGCSIIYLFDDKNDNKFILHSFQNNNERECKKGKYDNIFDKIVAKFKVI